MKLYVGSGNERANLLKKYRRMKIISIVLAIILALTFYYNYDYMAFKLLISENYVYTDTLDEIYEKILGKENVKGYGADFDRVVMSIVTERLRDMSGDKYTYLYTPYGYKTSKENEKTDAAKAYIKELSDEMVYVSIPNFSKGTNKFIMNNKKMLKDYKAIVIDLRNDYGGFLKDYHAISKLFLDKGMVLGAEKTRIPLFTKVVKSTKDSYFNFERIYILQNGNTASSAEAFIMSLKENLDNVVLVGTSTFGKGIGQITLPLRDGYAVKATVLELDTPKGESIHRVGIEPDIACDDAQAQEYALQDWQER